MSGADVNIWNTIQSASTSVFIALYPFVSCLLYQIRHEMASNPTGFLWRKLLLVTCLTSQVVSFTFLRDQYVWNEQISQEDQVPSSALCALSMFVSYAIFEAFSYYLIIVLIWDETETQHICTHQLNTAITQSIKRKSKDKRFYFSILFKIYSFCICVLTLIPASMLPSSMESAFIAGIDEYRCRMSNVSIFIGIANKLLFVCIALHSSIQLYRSESRHRISNSIAFFLVLPLSTLLHCFAISNELDTDIWFANVLSLDTSRKIGFLSLYVLTVFMVCNHLMMQAQAKQQIFSAARRISAPFVNVIDVARTSMRNSGLFRSMGLNKVGVGHDAMNARKAEEVQSSSRSRGDVEVLSSTDDNSRFSVAEITEDEYEEVHMIGHDEQQEEPNKNLLTQTANNNNHFQQDAQLISAKRTRPQSQSDEKSENVKVNMQIVVNMNVVKDKINESIQASQTNIQ